MKTTIVPVRHHQRANRWIATSFDRAYAYELRTAAGRLIRRVPTLAEAKRLAEILEPSRRRTREQVLGCRYSDVREEVASRRACAGTAEPIARSLTEAEYHQRSR